MPPWFYNPEEAWPFFVALRELGETVAAENLPRVQMQELSMGMSQDYEVAVEEGATIMRIGAFSESGRNKRPSRISAVYVTPAISFILPDILRPMKSS